MPNLEKAELKHSEVIHEIAQDFLMPEQAPEKQFLRGWEQAIETNSLMRVLVPRTALLEQLAAAYMSSDAQRFAHARSVLVAIAPKMAARFQFEPMALLDELSLTIIRADRSAAIELARLLRPYAQQDTGLDIGNWQAMILCALVDLHLEDAARYAHELKTACLDKAYTKNETERAQPWAEAAALLTRGEKAAAFEQLKSSSRAQGRYLNRELDRITKGAASQLVASDFLDLPCAALAQLIVDFGHEQPHDLQSDLPFSDFHWIASA